MPSTVNSHDFGDVGAIRQELRSYGIDHDRVDEIMVALIGVGQQVICASLGEIGGAHVLDAKALKLIVAAVVAHGR